MPISSAPPTKQQSSPSETDRNGKAKATGMLAWTSFSFALLQSICGFFVAVSGLRLLIGITSIAISASVAAKLDSFHANWIRIPMIVFALLGALLNMAIVIQIRYLRARAASRWRQRPPSGRTLRMERVQIALSVATLILLGIEEYLHFGYRHTL